MKVKHFIPWLFVVSVFLAVLVIAGSPMCWAENKNLNSHDEAVALLPMNSSELEPRASTPRGTMPVLTVPAAAFSSDGRQPTSFYYEFAGGYISGNSEAYGCVKAGIDLPEGVEILNFDVVYYDNDTSDQVWITLYKTDDDGNTTLITSVSSSVSDAGTSVETMWSGSLTDEVVVFNNSYSLVGCLNSSLVRLYAVHVWYTLQDQTYFNKIVIDPAGAP